MPAEKMIDWSETYQPDETWSIWSGSEWELSDLPLLVAQHDHIKWIQEILNTFDSGVIKLSENELSNHFECRLGNWYYGHGKTHYGHLESFQQLEAMHVDIHKLGHEVINLLKMGHTQEARQSADDLLAMKTQILTKLHELQKQVNFSSKKSLELNSPEND
ncbi:hypothetical protein A9Q92_06830 [Methylophaga sp. 42_8_T64]|nr:hypothetical protein A9Q92_06830 [Methylophaga sp. 42_8_T64]